MFHLQERQLNMLLGMLCGASVLLFCMMALPKRGAYSQQRRFEDMQDYSEAWICDYVTNDQDKIKEYLDEENTKALENNIREVVTLPASLPIKAGGTLVMTNKLPAITDDVMYMVFETKGQSVEVYAGKECLYKSSDRDVNISAYHIVSIPSQYHDMNVIIRLHDGKSGNGENSGGNAGKTRTTSMKVGRIFCGSYNELLASACSENSIYAVVAVLLLLLSVFVLAVWVLIPCKAYKKRLLFNASFLGLGLSVLFTLESRLFWVITGWNYSLHFARGVMILLVGVLYLLLVRCFVYKKKVLFLIDMGILFYGVCYVSFMVLQGFSLISFETVYRIGEVLFGLVILLYTVIFMVAVYDYGRKEGRPVLLGNGVLLFSMLIQFISWIVNRENASNMYLPLGFLLYLVLIWVYGLKTALYVEPIGNTKEEDEEKLRAEIVERMNPNLIFASFHTLQKMIKNGSANSVKMIYYISVYFRDNLRALDRAGEIVAFEEELEHVIAYLQLQKTRNQSLGFTVECKEKDFKLPRHSIEPIVENAVKHGVSGKETGGNVVVRSYRRADGYAIQVIDDGIGFDTKQLNRKRPTSLLRLLDQLKESCQAQAEIISKEGKGTVITIVLPMLDNDLLEESYTVEETAEEEGW